MAETGEKTCLIAYCGLNCAECNAFKATQTKDIERKKLLVKKWTDDDDVVR